MFIDDDSFWEVIEIVDVVFIHPHAETAERVAEQGGEPEDPEVDSVEVLVEEPFEDVLPDASVELSEIEQLIVRGPGVLNPASVVTLHVMEVAQGVLSSVHHMSTVFLNMSHSYLYIYRFARAIYKYNIYLPPRNVRISSL